MQVSWSNKYQYSEIQEKRIKCVTKKGANEENPQRHVDDGRSDIDEPVGKKGGYPQEDDVID